MLDHAIGLSAEAGWAWPAAGCASEGGWPSTSWLRLGGCAEVPHRPFLFTIPKRLRIYSRFGVDQSVRLEADDSAGVHRLIQSFLRCPFSQARMIHLRFGQALAGKVEVTDTGKVTKPQ
jgi:hypothetical protein